MSSPPSIWAKTEIQRVQQSGKIPPRENRYVDIYREKQIRVNVKVLVPVKEHPKVSNNRLSSGALRLISCLTLRIGIPVQFCGKVTGTKGEFHEASSGGDNV